MQRGEVLAAKAFDFQQGHGERIAQGERDRGTRGWRECFRTGFLGDRGVEDDGRLAAQRRIGVACQRDDRHAQPLELIDQAEQLVGGPALRQHHADIVATHDAEVAVQRVHGMEEHRRRAGGRERRGDLAGDQS